MAFIDEATISVHAGRGGNGCISFRREKYIPRGGPNGGSGGNGGSVIIRATRNRHSLLDFKFRPKYEAQKGEHGMGRDCDGRCGEDLILWVPVGTRILEAESKTLLTDLSQEGDTSIIARGGKGGVGNMHFATSTIRAPRIATPGTLGESKQITLELSMLADVGLVGLPNAGKSSFLRIISNARPKVADYPFTTLEPHLGVVNHRSATFIALDIPGLIEGASSGAGLGLRFLKHLSRNKILLHLVECTGAPAEMEKKIRIVERELGTFDSSLLQKQRLVVFTKSDLLSPRQRIAKERSLAKRGLSGAFISSHTHEGIEELLGSIGKLIAP